MVIDGNCHETPPLTTLINSQTPITSNTATVDPSVSGSATVSIRPMVPMTTARIDPRSKASSRNCLDSSAWWGNCGSQVGRQWIGRYDGGFVRR